MASPQAFTVGAEVFFDPHPGAQLTAVRRLAARVMRGEGPRRFFLRGNRGGGKSFLVRRGVLHALAMAIPGLKYVVVRRNMPDLRQNHMIYLGAEMRKLGGEWNETFGIAKYENGSMGFYRQCEDDADVEKVVGAEGAILFVDEAPQIKWEHQRTIAPSLRVPKLADGTQPYYTLEIYSGNPMGESIEEMDKYFIDKDVDELDDPTYNPDDWEVIPIGLQDNPSLDPAEYLKQFAGVPAHFRAAWVDGVRMDSRSLFEVHKTIDAAVRTKLGNDPRPAPLPEAWAGRPYHYIQELPTIGGVPLLQVPWIQVYRAFDMGFFPDPATCLWLAVFGRRIIAFHEETWFRTIPEDLATKMIETTGELLGETTVAMTYADPSIDEQRNDVITVKDRLENHGVPIECSVNDRVLYADGIHSLLGEEIEPGLPRFQVYEPGCPMLAKYLPKMRWDEKNPRKMADHKYDHWPVCLAYFAISSGVLSFSKSADETREPAWMAWMREDSGGSRRRRVS